jgi:hypothetical protein
VLGFWLVGIPLCFLLAFGADMGPRGLWIGLAVSLAVVAVVLLLRVRWRMRHLPARVSVDDEQEPPALHEDGSPKGERTLMQEAIDRELNALDGPAGAERGA